jgi:integrase
MASNKASKAILPRVGDTQTTPEKSLSHTVKRGSTYYYRRRIPLDLVAAYGGKHEVTYSLRTKDRAEAERKARRASVALDVEWEKSRAAMPTEPTTWPADYDFVEVAGKIVPVPPPRGGWPQPAQITQEEADRAEYEQLLAEEEVAEQNRIDEHLEIEAEEHAERYMQALRRAGYQPTHASVVPERGSTPEPTEANKPPPTTLDNLIEHWERERKPNTKTTAKMKLAALEFNLLHKDPAVQAITRPMVIAYRTHLLGTGKAKGTIDDRLSNIGTLLALAFDHGIVTANVAARAALPPDKLATKARIGYTPAQAEAVMAGTEQYRETHPARYWLPRLARWTGARLNELHQLRRQDLAERDGVRGISIIDEGEHAEGIPMRMKNAASRRWVPLHPALSEFWTWAAVRHEAALFPAVPDKHGIVSTEFSKWYGRTIRGKWGIEDKRVTFHGWRHSFADACRAAGIQDSIRYALMGHAESGAAGGYGSGELPPKVLAKAIQKLQAARPNG